MLESYLIALSIGLLWAISPILMIDLVRRNGALLSNNIRIVYAAVFFCILSIQFTDWNSIGNDAIVAGVLSGFIGVLIGDWLLYVCLKILGPRRNSMLFG